MHIDGCTDIGGEPKLLGPRVVGHRDNFQYSKFVKFVDCRSQQDCSFMLYLAFIRTRRCCTITCSLKAWCSDDLH